MQNVETFPHAQLHLVFIVLVRPTVVADDNGAFSALTCVGHLVCVTTVV